MKRRTLIHLFLIISIIPLVKGCSNVTTFKDYRYTRVSKNYVWGEFEGSLQGQYKKLDNNIAIRGENYNLDLFFTSVNKDSSNLLIKKVQLINIKKEIIFEEKNKKIKFKLSEFTKKNTATVFLKNIHIEKYSDLLLIIEFSLDTKNSYTLQQHFIKNFKEEKISFWDKLMGV